MKLRRIVPVLALSALVVLALFVQRARASVTLTTPIVTTTSAVACTSFQCTWGGGTDLSPVNCYINYQAVDGSGNFLNVLPAKSAGPLQAADLNAFVTTSGNARVRCQAALVSNQPSLAGTQQ
jgi:hypothetical protein